MATIQLLNVSGTENYHVTTRRPESISNVIGLVPTAFISAPNGADSNLSAGQSTIVLIQPCKNFLEMISTRDGEFIQ